MADASGGNPRAVCELVAAARLHGTLVDRHGLADLTGAPPINAALAALVDSEMGRISARARQALELLALVGALPANEPAIAGSLDELLHAQLVIADGTTVRAAPSPIPYVLRTRTSMVRRRLAIRQLPDRSRP